MPTPQLIPMPSSKPSFGDAAESPKVDVVVIGGGINGVGVARDCALRGMSVALFEKNDFGFGASGNNSGMLHGGPRYLLKHPHVTRSSCVDSGYIQQAASHLIFRIPFLFPVEGRGWRARTKLAALDAFFAFYDKYQPLKGGKKHALLSPRDLHELESGLVGDFAGAVSFDEWGVDAPRLCALTAVDAAAHGALVHTHCSVKKLLRNASGAVGGVVAADALTDASVVQPARYVVNATGAWCNHLLSDLCGEEEPLIRPGKGIHVVYDRRLSHYGIIVEAIDGRDIFLMPWMDISWIATTDDDFFGNPDRIRGTDDEVGYLVDGISRVFPQARSARVIDVTAAARPTLYARGVPESFLSREHEIIDHGNNLFSMIGGKLASYRLFAQEMTDRLAVHLGSQASCTTHLAPLPGGGETLDYQAFAQDFALEPAVAERVLHRHGGQSRRLLKMHPDASDRAVACACESVLTCEVKHACRQEFARTLEDVSRRTRLGLGPCQGLQCALPAAQTVARELGYGAHAAGLMAQRWFEEQRQRRAAAMPLTLRAQDELIEESMGYRGLGLDGRGGRL